MRTPRFWASTLILPEADIAIGPLPVPGIAVKVHSGFTVELIGDNFTYRVHALGGVSLDWAEHWVVQDLGRHGFADVRWIRPERSRVFFARRSPGQHAARVGWIAHAGGEARGQLTILEHRNASVRTDQEARSVAEGLIRVAEMWIRPLEHPDDAIVHALLQSSELDLSFRLPAGTTPAGYAFGMVQTARAGRDGPCRFVADGILARNGQETRALADALAADPGLRDAMVRMVDADVAEVHGSLHDDMGQEAMLHCRVVPADEGAGLLVATLALGGEPPTESKKLLAAVTSSVQALGAQPRPIPEGLPATAAEALQIVDSFRRRIDPTGERVARRGS